MKMDKILEEEIRKIVREEIKKAEKIKKRKAMLKDPSSSVRRRIEIK